MKKVSRKTTQQVGMITHRKTQSPCSIYDSGSGRHKIELEEGNCGGHDPNTRQHAKGERRGERLQLITSDHKK